MTHRKGARRTGASSWSFRSSMYERLLANGRIAIHDIHFDVGTADLRMESEPALSAISAMLLEHPDVQLRIEVHTDNAGAAENNQLLSEARAHAAVQYVIACGVDARRLRAVGCGSSQPVAPNDTPENRQRNRRIELVLAGT